ncbi:MAG: hypothetical protein WDN72_10850 [Alphaproteobacteria bacterium]
MGFIFGLIIIAAFIYPAWKILDRMGFNGAWSLLCLIPLAPLVGLWIIALQPWPAGGKPPSAPLA